MKNSASSKLVIATRIALGALFFVFGLNGFLNFIPQPPMPEAAGAFMGGLAASGYFFPLLKGTEVVAGALLLTGKRVPLALTLLAPIVVQILAFHVFLAPGGLPVAVVAVALELSLAWAYRDAFAPMLAQVEPPRARIAPTAGRAQPATA